MPQLFHFGPYYWFGSFETELPPGAAQLVSFAAGWSFMVEQNAV